jgi:type IV secretory pathway VirB6-like protein
MGNLSLSVRQILLTALLALVSVMSAVSYAQISNVDPAGNVINSLEPPPFTTDPAKARSMGAAAAASTRKLIGDVERQIASISSAGAFNALGKRILAVLGTVVVIWSVLKNMLLKPGLTQIVADLVFPFVVIALGLAALDQNLADLVLSSVQGLAGSLGSGSSGGATTTQTFAINMLASIERLWTESPPAQLSDLGTSYLAALALQLVAVAFLVLATAIGLGVLFMAKFQVALAVALAPVMIPWLLWRPTEFLFSGWLSFLLKGAFISVAVFAIEGAIRSSVAGMSNIAAMAAPGVDSAMTFGALALMAMLFAFLLLKSAEIGGGIISGAVSGIGGFQAISNGAAAGALKGMARGSAGAIGGAAGLGRAYQTGASVRGLQDRQLTQLQKAVQPRAGGLKRVAYELGRRAGPDDRK